MAHGMLTAGAAPPIAMGSPATLLTTITAVAPVPSTLVACPRSRTAPPPTPPHAAGRARYSAPRRRAACSPRA